jgi:hypothetical protein
MNREYQVIYQQRTGDTVSEPKIIRVVAPTEDAAENSVRGDGVSVLSVTELRAVVDWDKPVWGLEEYAAALNLSGNYLCKKKASGEIPWNETLRGVPSKIAKRFIESGMNDAGKKFLD